MHPTRRARGRLVLDHVQERFRGAVVGQHRLIESLVEECDQAYGPTFETVQELVARGFLRRVQAGRSVVLFMPEFLMDGSAPAGIDDLFALRRGAAATPGASDVGDVADVADVASDATTPDPA